MQLHVLCNLSYATTQICSCMCRMQLNFSCMRQLQNPKFLVMFEYIEVCIQNCKCVDITKEAISSDGQLCERLQ
jgi:hypothetical protein